VRLFDRHAMVAHGITARSTRLVVLSPPGFGTCATKRP
jgi:hypothetical protein